jgi:hypothetical protein
MGTAHECDKLISFPYSQRLGATLAQALETGLASWVPRARAAESVSCVFPAPQLKREQSLAARFGRADASYYDISSTWIANGFLTPACQSGLPTGIVLCGGRMISFTGIDAAVSP